MPAQPCVDVLQQLHDAVIALQTGQMTTSISFNNRTVSYSQANVKALGQLYRAYYRSCGPESGLPDISDQALVERGPPACIR